VEGSDRNQKGRPPLNIITDDGIRIALHTLGRPQDPPVLLVPGTFSNATFWTGTRGVGFARTLSDAGFYACVLDPRGHGDSARPRTDQKWDIDDWARRDLPAALNAIGRPVHLIGHSAGGAVALAMLSAEPALRQRVLSLTTIGTPLPWLQPWRGAGAWVIRAASNALGRFPARLLRMGPEDELPAVMSQWMTWNLKGHWMGDDGTDYTNGLADLQLPVLMIAGSSDWFFAPPAACRGLFDRIGSDRKQFVVYDGLNHVGLVVSRQARELVWPRMLEFLRQVV
jgi:pimeloyl-ACP methyl ester carboxylesterase